MTKTNILNMLVCPKCHGTGRAKVSKQDETYKEFIFHYNKETDTVCCDNCGFQYGAAPTGIVKANKDNQPCLHQYQQITMGRCYTKYTCEYCGDWYSIDSSD